MLTNIGCEGFPVGPTECDDSVGDLAGADMDIHFEVVFSSEVPLDDLLTQQTGRRPDRKTQQREKVSCLYIDIHAYVLTYT